MRRTTAAVKASVTTRSARTTASVPRDFILPITAETVSVSITASRHLISDSFLSSISSSFLPFSLSSYFHCLNFLLLLLRLRLIIIIIIIIVAVLLQPIRGLDSVLTESVKNRCGGKYYMVLLEI